MKSDYGLTGVGMVTDTELYILANTPGIPLEWLYAACGIRRSRRSRLRRWMGLPQFVELGQTNAATVVEGDGWKLLLATPLAGYAGAVPLWSQLELRADPRSDGAIAAELGVHRLKVRRWRTNPVFDPVSGMRLIGSRGRQAAA